ncbi:unnamed protein product, partial [Mesorhabditis spiculigera]
MPLPFELLHMEVVRYAREQEALANVINPREALEGIDKSSNALVYKALASRNAATRLESMGVRVGYLLAEKICKDLPRITTELEIMKFVCKEFWINVFGRQVDNLRTNHQGTYVVQDNRFPFISSFAEGAQYTQDALVYLVMPCGIIRGALSALGIQALVTHSTELLPTVKFHIHLSAKA